LNEVVPLNRYTFYLDDDVRAALRVIRERNGVSEKR